MIRLSIVLILLCSFANAQENFILSKVIQADNTSKDELFTKINLWFGKTYNSAKDVIQMSDREGGVIVGKGLFSYSFGKTIYGCYDGNIDYAITVQVKDNRFRVELSDFNHGDSDPTNPFKCALGLITTAELHSESGISKKYNNAVWNDIKLKSETYSNDIFQSIESSLKSDGADF
ncbi:MAG: DUF4468 domain-containing protein [Bacteroidetes bacterium]|nr:DUF4468 domain-containing protein [Bacteroidota bacterium]MDA1122344.1 DUF4468 domain-containing protein [Bacteroidota bacterium]